MFECDLSIIRGNYSVGKSTFIFDFARMLKNHLNYKICFIGASKEIEFEKNKFKDTFDLIRFYDKEIKTTELISELLIRDKYDFIFIDDIDHILYEKSNKWLDRILKIPISKIATFSVFPPFAGDKIEINGFKFETYHIGGNFPNTTINGINSNKVIEQFIRNKKLEKIF